MLVLRRKVAQTIVVDGTITFQILSIEGDRISVGITAPPEIPIVCGELLTGQETPTASAPLPQKEARRRPARSRTSGAHA